MKKAVLFIYLLGTMMAWSQNNYQDVQLELQNDYNVVNEVSKVLPTKTFLLSDLKVLNPYSDAGASAEAQQTEEAFSAIFNGSSWTFDALDAQNGQQKITVKTTSGQVEQGNYLCVGATFKSGKLIEGMDLEAYLFQSKAYTDRYRLVFSLPSGLIVISHFQR